MLDPTWMPEFVCPECESTLVIPATPGASTGRWICHSCDAEVACRGGILRFLSDTRLAQVEPLIAQYRRVREQDGYRQRAAAYYRELPRVARSDPQQAVWRIRQESFRHLCTRVLARLGRRPLRVLDLGAGNGWLSHRLALLGNVCVATLMHGGISIISPDGRTTSHVQKLSDDERIDEIARMIGGVKVGDAARRAAQELLAAKK